MSDILFQWRNCTTCQIVADQSIVAEIFEEYKFRPKGFKFTPKYKAGIWDGFIKLISASGICPVGLVPDVMKFALSCGYSIKASEEFRAFKDTPEYDIPSLDIPFELRDYQIAAIDRAMEKKRQILLLATSAGKSVVIYSMARLFQGKTLIIVPNVSLISQIESDFKNYSKTNGFDVDKNCHFISAGVEKNTDKPIVISTWQSIHKIPNDSYFKQFDNVIGDECHLYTAECSKNILNRCTNAFYRIGMSGTLKDSKTDEKALVSSFGPVTKIVSAKQLMDAGHVTEAIVKPIVLVYPEATCKPIRGLPYDDELDIIVNSKRRNKFLAGFADSLVGNSLFLFRFVDKHAEVVKQLIESNGSKKKVHIITADTKKNDREALRGIIESSDDNIIISTYALFSTGVSINNLHHVVFASPTASSVKVLQSIGRSLRLHESKAIATVWDIVDDFRGDFKTKNYLLKHFEQRLESYLSEQFEIKVKEIKL